MAQAQYDKFIELRKSGVDAKTARTQAYGDIPTAPNPPVTPPPTPAQNFPSQPINQQTTTGVNGETFQVAPVNTQGVTPQVAPVQPVTPPPTQTPTTPTTTPPKEAPIDYTQAQGREQDIITNLEKFKSQNMTPDQIKAASGYNEAKPEKKAIIEGFLNPVKQDSGTIFNTLKLGGSVPTSDTPEYKQAQARYNTFKKFSTYDVASLSTAMQDGSLLMGTQAYNDVISDPAMLAKVQRARAFTSGNVDMTVIGEKSGQYVMTSNPTVAKALSDGYMSQEEYDSLTNNPSVEAQAKVVSEARAKYDEYKRQLEEISDTVDEEYKTDNEIFRNAVKSNLDKSIRRLFNSASDDLQNALGTYTELKNSSTALLEINMKQYETEQAEQRQLAQEARQQQYAQEQAVFNAGLAQENAVFQNTLQQGNAQFQTIGDKVYKVQNGQMTDTGIKAEKDAQYQALGGKLYKIKGDSVTEVPGIVTETPRAETQDWGKLDDTTLYNQRTGEIKRVSASEASAYGPSTVEVTPDAIKGLSSRLSGNNVQCGMVSNDYMAKYFPQAPRMGDSYESKVKSVEAIGVSDVPQVGGVFAMNTYNSNGHTGIVQSVDMAKGTFTATDANRAGSQNGGPVTTSTYNISDNLTFSKAPAGAGTIRPSDIDYFNSATATDKKKLSSNPQYVDFNNKKSIVMSDPNADIYEVMKFSQGGKDMGEERLKSLGKFSQGLSQVAELSKKVQEIQTGPIIGRIRSYNPYDANAQALLAEINATVPNIARGVYGEVGVLTDADIQNYAKTLPNIKSTEDTNKLVLAMTLKTMLNGFKGQIQIDGSAGRDVSGFVGTVKQYEDRINQLLSTLGGGNASSPSSILTPEDTAQFDNLY